MNTIWFVVLWGLRRYFLPVLTLALMITVLYRQTVSMERSKQLVQEMVGQMRVSTATMNECREHLTNLQHRLDWYESREGIKRF